MKNSNFREEKPGRYYVNLMINVNITSVSHGDMYPLIWHDEKGTSRLCYSSTKNIIYCNHKKTLGKFKWETFYKIWPLKFKIIKVNKNKVSLRNYHRLEETKEISWLSSTWSSRLYPGTEVGHQRKDLGIRNAVC